MITFVNKDSRLSTCALGLVVPLLACGCASSGRTHDDVGYLNAPSGKLYYEAAGDGPPVVLIHGGQMDLRIWDEQVALLSPNHRVIRYDVRGYGRSPAPQKVYANHEDLAAVLDQLGLHRATLVGLSLGGGIAIDFAISYPDRVEKLVAVAPGLSGFDWSPGAWDA
ncbi:MAG: alpha/beta fold hydrolase, partial [Phycisphaerales bacterium]|nr:alpha/beta fold hydrolase [Phycisphaerales bacterium]